MASLWWWLASVMPGVPCPPDRRVTVAGAERFGRELVRRPLANPRRSNPPGLEALRRELGGLVAQRVALRRGTASRDPRKRTAAIDALAELELRISRLEDRIIRIEARERAGAERAARPATAGAAASGPAQLRLFNPRRAGRR